MKAFVIIILIALIGCMSMMGVSGVSEKDRQMLREAYVRDHPNLDSETKSAILNGKIFIGMTADQVRASWGAAHDVNRTVGSWGIHEQWVYGYNKYYGSGFIGFVATHYLYFEDGILTSWQD